MAAPVTFELGFVDLRGILRSKAFTSPRSDAWFSETVLMHRSDGTAAKSGAWGQLHHPSVLAKVSTTYQSIRSEFGFANLVGPDGEPHPLCIRSVLADTESRLVARGIHPTVGYELEFYSDHEAADHVAAGRSDTNLYGSRLQRGDGFLVIDALLEEGTVVGETIDHFCREFEHGQYEIATSPTSAVLGADRLVLVRELLQAVARKAQSPVNLDPQPYSGRVGSALQISVVLGELCDGLVPSSALKACAAAITQCVVGNALVFGPVESSYARFRNEEFSSLRDWGVDRRDCVVRIARSGGGWRLEVRLADCRANVHLCTHLVLHAILKFLESPASAVQTPVQVALPDSLEAAVERFRATTSGGLSQDLRGALAAVLEQRGRQGAEVSSQVRDG